MFSDLTKDSVFILEIRRMYQKVGCYQKQALGVTREILEKLPLATEAGNQGAKDHALLLVAYDTMYRIAELVSLLIEDIRYSETNGVIKARSLIRKIKTDQLAKGIRLNPNHQATELINLW